MCFSGFGWDKEAHDQQTARPFPGSRLNVISPGAGGEKYEITKA
jgi:hypothetical protein